MSLRFVIGTLFMVAPCVTFGVLARAEAPRKRLNYTWSLEVVYPDKTRTTIKLVPGANRAAMQSSEWECGAVVKAGQPASDESGSVSCFFHKLGSASTSTRCGDGRTDNQSTLLVTETEVDGSTRDHVLFLRCTK